MAVIRLFQVNGLPDVSNPDELEIVGGISNPDVSNPDVSNPDVSNPDVSN
ncbi:MAG: hypothetical protein HXX20_22355, partial [Chloroflexi bacterium]|nr:hypothetical protein [Chloroflexota bacterium]